MSGVLWPYLYQWMPPRRSIGPGNPRTLENAMSNAQDEQLMMLIQQLIDLLRSSLTGSVPMLRPRAADALRKNLVDALREELVQALVVENDRTL